jgi:hypothetical protein
VLLGAGAIILEVAEARIDQRGHGRRLVRGPWMAMPAVGHGTWLAPADLL